MLHVFRGVAIGAASGAVAYALSLYALGYTHALAMPQGFPFWLWEAFVILGLGAALVALLVHFASVRFLGAPVLPALAAFLVTTLGLLAANGHLPHGRGVLAAWATGAILASVVLHWLRPDNSLKPQPLRGSA